MNKTGREAADFVKEYASKLPEWVVPTVLLVPFTALSAVSAACTAAGIPRQKLAYGAQNFYFELSGAFTGEVSADMLAEHEVRYVVCGHSERRHIFGESSELVGKKVARAIEKGILPILCIGETLPERESGKLESVLIEQIEAGVALVPRNDVTKIIIAYEPVWAIGTGVVATPQQAQDAHSFVRGRLTKLYNGDAKKIPILYGGSVNPENALSLLSLPDIDGALVGGASLKVDSLLALHTACVKAAREKGIE